jgi:hypothetical protein
LTKDLWQYWKLLIAILGTCPKRIRNISKLKS